MIGRDGARPSGLVAVIGYAQHKVTRYLRGSSPKVDLVEHDDRRPLPPRATSRVVYSFDVGELSSRVMD